MFFFNVHGWAAEGLNVTLPFLKKTPIKIFTNFLKEHIILISLSSRRVQRKIFIISSNAGGWSLRKLLVRICWRVILEKTKLRKIDFWATVSLISRSTEVRNFHKKSDLKNLQNFPKYRPYWRCGCHFIKMFLSRSFAFKNNEKGHIRSYLKNPQKAAMLRSYFRPWYQYFENIFSRLLKVIIGEI